LIVLCLAGSGYGSHGCHFGGRAGANSGYGYGYGLGYDYGYDLAAGYAPERLPYYALYPPVYYGSVERRPFGQSPFAYPPYPAYTVPAESGQDQPSSQPPARPLRIVNPYVKQAAEAFELVPAPPKPKEY
jgi:hypothetical protein